MAKTPLDLRLYAHRGASAHLPENTLEAYRLAAPSLRRFSEKGQLVDAARQLRAELLGARLKAIEGGVPVYFQYQTGSPLYAFATGPDQVAASAATMEQVPQPDPQPAAVVNERISEGADVAGVQNGSPFATTRQK